MEEKSTDRTQNRSRMEEKSTDRTQNGSWMEEKSTDRTQNGSWMEEKNTERTEKETLMTGTETPAAEDSSSDQASARKTGSSGLKWKIVLVLLALILAGCAYGWHYWNLPEQQLKRILQESEKLLAEGDYENAAAGFSRAMEIDERNTEAVGGWLQARMAIAEEAAEAGGGIPERARVCGLFEEIIAFCDEKTDYPGTGENGPAQDAGDASENGTTGSGGAQDTAGSGTTQNSEKTEAPGDGGQLAAIVGPVREQAADRLARLRREIAEDYDSVKCETVRDDRSGKVVLTDGTEVPYTWFYDLVQITDEDYPLADEINAVLKAQKEAFFSGEQTNPSEGIGGVIPRAEGDYQDYVGEAGIYSGKGILSIRMAEIRSAGSARAGFFRGKTFRLSDGKELTLADVTDRTDSGLKHLVKKKIREWFENEGYSSVSMSDVEDYIEQTAPEELKFCIHEDGVVYLAVDQEMPFFTGAGEILEIPLN